jgi:hypothetical protein
MAEPWYAQHPNLISGAPEENIPKELDLAYPVTYAGGTTDAASAQPLELREGTNSQLRFTLQAVPAVHVVVKREENQMRGSFELVARGPEGAPLSGQSPVMGRPGGEQLSVAPGRYDLLQRNGRETIKQHLEIASDTTIDLAGRQPLALTGRITFEGSDPPPANPIVLLSGGNMTYAGRGDSSGRLTFQRAAPGHLRVSLYSARGFYLQSISINGSKAASNVIDIPESGSVDLSVAAARAAVEKLEGTVELDGKPAPGMMVLLVPEDLSHLGLLRRDQSDSDGSFSLPNVAPGRYRLLALDGDSQLAYHDPAVIGPYLTHGQSVSVFPGFNQKLRATISK